MELKEFLYRVYGVTKTFTKETSPDAIQLIFEYYNDLQRHINKSLPNLLLVYGKDIESKFLIFRNETYIMLNLAYFEVFTEIFDCVNNGYVKKESVMSILSHLSINEIFSGIIDDLYNIRHEDFGKLTHIHDGTLNQATSISIKDQDIVFIIFFLGHEIFHYISSDDSFETFKIESDPVNFDEIDDGIERMLKTDIYTSLLQDHAVLEEISADRFSLVLMWKFLVFRRAFIKPSHFSYSVLLCSKTLKLLKYLEACSGKSSQALIIGLDIREILAQRECTLYYDNFIIATFDKYHKEELIEIMRYICGSYERYILICNYIINKTINRILHIIQTAYGVLSNLVVSTTLFDNFQGYNSLFSVSEDIYGGFSDGMEISSEALTDALGTCLNLIDWAYEQSPFKNTSIDTKDFNMANFEQSIIKPQLNFLSRFYSLLGMQFEEPDENEITIEDEHGNIRASILFKINQ